ncbi:CoA pyrophosphatase [Agaribacterium sp. ZY112]|uniref:NUDIX hydrolase n=1 Tax=Agaribacterium sp. ZY112 TaxID=3233574 RepID=UPI0035266BD5
MNINIRREQADAAVLLVLAHIDSCECILLTQRAQHLREHAGEVAFPGGKRDCSDSSLYRTALRESEEEVGLAEHQLRYRSELSMQATRAGACVVPFVVELVGEPNLQLNADEIASSFWAPLSLFVEDRRSHTDIFKLAGQEYWAPAYLCQGYTVWGFTARVLVDFVNTYYGGQVRRQHHAVERRHF